MATNNSIILSYDDKVDIVYNENGYRAFLYVNRSGMTAEEAQVPDLDEVRDMEIAGDMVYFCGVMNGNEGIGWFDINTLFFSGGSVSFIPILPVPVYSNPLSFTLRKLEVYNPIPGVIHVFVLGDMVYGAPLNIPPDYTYLFDVRYDGFGWQIDGVYDPNGDYLFDDLTLTANYLMVAGHKYAGGDYSHTAATLSAVTTTILNLSNLPMHSCAPNDYYILSRHLIEALDNDEYIMASYGMYEMTPGVIFSYYSSPGNLVYRWMVPNVTTTSEFRELRKRVSAKEVYLVPDHNYSLTTDQMYSTDYGTVTGLLSPQQLEILHSLDRKPNGNGMIVSGQIPGGDLRIWEALYKTTSCATADILPLVGTIHDVTDWDMEVKPYYSEAAPFFYMATVTTYQILDICVE